MGLSKTQRIKLELEKIAKANSRAVTPEDLVAFAKREKKSALHGEFNWNVQKAAHAHWLLQARNIIRVYVPTNYPKATGPGQVTVSNYVSLTTERGEGYRPLVDIMDDKKDRTQFLRDIIMRLVSIKEVEIFPELAGVARAIATAKRQYVDIIEKEEAHAA